MTGNINKKDISVSSGTVTAKTYDGNNNASVSTLTFAGLISGESLVINTDYTVSNAAFADANAGTGKTVTADVTLNSTSTTSNYNLTNGAAYNGLTGDINKKDISVIGGTIAPKTYDGTTDVTVQSVTFSGLENGEQLDMNTDYTVNAAFTDPAAGIGTKTVQMTLTLNSVPKADNYNLTNGVNFQLTGQTIMAGTAPTPDLLDFDLSSVYYDGQTHAIVVTPKPAYTGKLGAVTVKYNGSDRLPVEPGTYLVTVDITMGTVYAAVTGLVLGEFTIAQPNVPMIRRSVTLPSLPGVMTLPAAGIHFVFSREDFVFDILAPVSGRPVVTTGRETDGNGGAVCTPNADGSYTVRIRYIQQDITVAIDFVDNTTGNTGIPAVGSVYASGGRLYIAATRTGQAYLYTSLGTRVTTLTLPAGETVVTTLPPGLYFVVLEGRSYKVIVGN
jgi:hypothetical protein